MNASVHQKTCTRIFIAVLFIMTKIWKQPKCPSPVGWITGYTVLYSHGGMLLYGMEYYNGEKSQITATCKYANEFTNTCCVLSRFSWVKLCATLWTKAYQAPLSMGFSRQEYWSGCPAFLQGIFPTQGLNPHLL